MATRLELRNQVKDKLVGLEDSGYGDFEYTDSELNTYLALAVARLYPSLYRKVRIPSVMPTAYGSVNFGFYDTPFADRVFQVEDAIELETLYGWRVSVDRIVGIETEEVGAVNVYYTDAYVLPPDDATPLGAPGVFTPLIVLGALIEALESRQDSGVRGDEPPTGQLHELPLIDRLQARYETLKRDIAMSLPVVNC